MEPKRSLPCSEQSDNVPHSEPDESNPHPHTAVVKSSILISSFHLQLGVISWLFYLGLSIKTVYPFLTFHARYMSSTSYLASYDQQSSQPSPT
jgi:hypothetical protein